jgi:poly(ribitol-phosphate) beta-N-acetylglucosaminyltransferase
MKYKISIVIPIHNIEEHLEKTLNSLINQTIGIENLEVIMVDDYSTDGTKDIIKNYTEKYENFIDVTLNNNSGLPGKPRNIGLRRATSDFVMFMDHDDYYAEDACEILYNKITKENADMVFCNFKFDYDDGSVKYISRYKDKSEIKIDKIDDDIEFLALPPSIWTKIFRRSFIIKNNILFPEGMLAEDVSFFIHTLLKANGIIFLNNYYGYNYRIRDSEADKSTIHIRNKDYLHAMILGYNDTYNILKQEKKDSYFAIIFKEHLEYWMKCFILSNTTKSEKLELLNDAAFLFEKQADPCFESFINVNEYYLELFDKIKNKEFDDAILISEVSSIFLEKDIVLRDKYRKLIWNNQNLRKQLNSKKNQVSVLQTVKGWSTYKTKNILIRLKNKIKI